MGMTMTQKILAAHAGLDKVEAGQLISAKLDIVLAQIFRMTALVQTAYGKGTTGSGRWLFKNKCDVFAL